MTLFITGPRRSYEISDVYVVALTFITAFGVTKITKQFIEKNKKNKNSKKIKMRNPRGGSQELKLSDDNELAATIISCIADNEKYVVKSPKMKKLIFKLLKKNLETESLVMTPNLLRLLAFKLMSDDQTLMVKIGNIVVSSNNRVRLLTRLSGTFIIGVLGAIFSTLPYAIFMVLIYFEGSQNCGYNCDAHFQHVPKESIIRIYGEQSSGHLAIAENNDARQVEIYITSKFPDEVIDTNTKQKIVKKTFKRTKKARLVNFADFKETDRVLSKFKNLKEPHIPQKSCSINDIHDIVDIRID
jgi:hypothetical protein